MFSSAFAIALLFSQATAEAPAQPAAKPAEDPKEKVVCRSVAPVGSMIPKRTCKKVREWNALANATRTELEQGSMSGGSNSN